MLGELIKFILSLFSSRPPEAPSRIVFEEEGGEEEEEEESLRKESPPNPTIAEIDWSNPSAKISPHFTVHEATYLPSWKIHHIPTAEEQREILKTAQAMERVREVLGTPITVHCWIRPKAVNCPGSRYHGRDYNAAVGGSKNSPHITGAAVDWHSTDPCDLIRAKLKPRLEQLEICVENLPGSNWVHVDTYPPRRNTGRFFRP